MGFCGEMVMNFPENPWRKSDGSLVLCFRSCSIDVW